MVSTCCPCPTIRAPCRGILLRQASSPRPQPHLVSSRMVLSPGMYVTESPSEIRFCLLHFTFCLLHFTNCFVPRPSQEGRPPSPTGSQGPGPATPGSQDSLPSTPYQVQFRTKSIPPPANNALFQVIPAYYDAKGALVSLGTGAGVAGGPGGPVRLLASPAPPLPHQVKFISLISILYSNYFQPSLDPQSRQYLPQPHFLAAEETLWTETQTPPSPHPWATTTSRSRVNKELVAGEGSQAMELWARRAWLVSLVPQDPSPLLP